MKPRYDITAKAQLCSSAKQTSHTDTVCSSFPPMPPQGGCWASTLTRIFVLQISQQQFRRYISQIIRSQSLRSYVHAEKIPLDYRSRARLALCL